MKFPIELRINIEGKPYIVTLLPDNQYELVELTADQESLASKIIKVYNLWREKGELVCLGIRSDRVRIYFSSGFWRCTHSAEIKDLPVPIFTQEEIDWLVKQYLIYKTFPGSGQCDYSLNGDKLRVWIRQQIKDTVLGRML